MADVYKGLTIQFRGDASGLAKALNQIDRESRGVARELKQIQQAMKFNSSSPALATKQIELMRKQIELTTNRLNSLKQSEAQAFANKNTNTEQWTKLQADIAATEGRLKSFQQQLAQVYIKQDAANSVLGKAGAALTNFGTKYEGLGRGMQTVGNTLSRTVTPAIIATGAASVAAAVKIDTSLTNVRKTVDGTEEQYQALKDAAIEFSKTNAVSASEILDIQSLGAQLGFAIDELDEFSQVVSGLDIATNMDAEQAATEMAHFANITKMSHDDVSRYGSAIVDLGNHYATTESDISSMAMRIAAAGTQIGMSQADILGLAAALSSMGIEAEAGGTAISTIMANIDKAVATGSDSLNTWAETAQMSAEQFAAAWQSNPVEALAAVLSGMEAASAEGSNMSLMLDELGIKSLRQTDVLKRLAGNSQLVTDAVKTSNQAWQQNSALQAEVDNRNNSLAAKFEMIKNRLTAIAESVGGPLADAFLDVLDAAEPLIQAIESGAKAFADMSKEEQQTVLAAVGFAAAIGPILSLLGGGIANISRFGQALSSMAQFFSRLGGAGKQAKVEIDAVTTSTAQLGTAGEKASKGIKMTSAAIGAMRFTGIMLAIGLVGDLVGKFVEYQKQVDTAKGATDGLAEAVKSIDASYAVDGIDTLKQSTDQLMQSSEDVLKSQSDLARDIGDTWKKIGTDSATLDYYVGKIDELTQKSQLSAREQAELAAAVEGYNQITGGNIKVIDAASGQLDTQIGALDRNAEAWKRNAEAQAAAAEMVELKKTQFSLEGELEGINQELANSAEGFGIWAGDFAIYADEASVKHHDLTKRQQELTKALDENAAAQDRISGKYQEAQQALQNLNQPFDEIKQSLTQATEQWPQLAESVGSTTDQVAQSLADLGVKQQDLANLTPEQWQTIAEGAQAGGDALVQACESVGLGVETAAQKAQQAAQEMSTAFAGLGSEGGANFQTFAESFGMNVDQMTQKMGELGINAQQMAELTPQTFQTMADGLGLSLADMATRLQEFGVMLPEQVRAFVEQTSANLQNLTTAFDSAFGEGSLSTFAANLGMSMDQVVAMLSAKGVEIGTVTTEMVNQMATALNQSPEVVLSALSSLGAQIPDEVQSAFAGAGPAAASGGEQAMSEGAQGMEQGVEGTDLSGSVSTVVDGALDSARGHEGEFQSIGTSLGNSLSSGFASADMASMSGAMDSALAIAQGYTGRFQAVGAESANAYGQGIASGNASAASNLVQQAVSQLQSGSGQFQSEGSNAGGQYASGISSQGGAVSGASSGLASNASAPLTSASGTAFSSGSHVGSQFAAGIRSQVGSVASAASALAAAAAAYIQHSKPEKGPLSPGEELFGKHAGENFAKGLRARTSIKKVEQASEKLAQAVADYIGHSNPPKGPLAQGEWIFGVHAAINFAEGLGSSVSVDAVSEAAESLADAAAEAWTRGLLAAFEARSGEFQAISHDLGNFVDDSFAQFFKPGTWAEARGNGNSVFGLHESVYQSLETIHKAGYKSLDDWYKKEQELNKQYLEDQEAYAKGFAEHEAKLADIQEDANRQLRDAEERRNEQLKQKNAEAWKIERDYNEKVADTLKNRDEQIKRETESWQKELDAINERNAAYQEFQDIKNSLATTDYLFLKENEPLFDFAYEININTSTARKELTELARLSQKTGVIFSQDFVERIADGSEESLALLHNLAMSSSENVKQMTLAFEDMQTQERMADQATRSLWVNSLQYAKDPVRQLRDLYLDYKDDVLDVTEALYSDTGLSNAFKVAGVSAEQFALDLGSVHYSMEDFTRDFENFTSQVSNGMQVMDSYKQTDLNTWMKNLKQNMAESQAYAKNLQKVMAAIPDTLDSEAFRKAVLEGGYSEWGHVMADLAKKNATQIAEAVDLYNQAILEGQQSAIDQFRALAPGEEYVQALMDSMSGAGGALAGEIESVLGQAQSAASGQAGQWTPVGAALIDAVSSGVTNQAGSLAAAAKAAVDSALSAAKAAAAAGMASIKAQISAMESQTKSAISKAQQALSAAGGSASGLRASQSVSTVSNSAATINNNYNVTVRNNTDLRTLMDQQNKATQRALKAEGVRV